MNKVAMPKVSRLTLATTGGSLQSSKQPFGSPPMSASFPKTKTGCTITAEGPIKHRRITARGIEFEAPVALELERRRMNWAQAYARPKRTSDGRLLFALPGGGEIAAP